MPPMNGSFDATQFAPSQTMQAHPAGVYDATISNTAILQVKDKQAGRFEVEFSTPAGRIKNNYNLWADPNQEKGAKMVEIAVGQLSALCHATGIFRIDWGNEGAALRGGRCKIEVGPQVNNDQYSEVKRVLDAQGNEPGRNSAPANPPNQGFGGQAAVPSGNAPVEAQNPGQWGNAQPQPQPSPQPQQGGWGQQPPQPNPAQQPSGNAQGGWTPGPQVNQGGGNPGGAPWGN